MPFTTFQIFVLCCSIGNSYLQISSHGKECYKHANDNAACKARLVATLKLCVKVCLVLDIFSMNYSKSDIPRKLVVCHPLKLINHCKNQGLSKIIIRLLDISRPDQCICPLKSPLLTAFYFLLWRKTHCYVRILLCLSEALFICTLPVHRVRMYDTYTTLCQHTQHYMYILLLV